MRDAVDVRVEETDFVFVSAFEKLALPDVLPVMLDDEEGEAFDAVGIRDTRGVRDATLADEVAEAAPELDAESDMYVADGWTLNEANKKLELRDGRSVEIVDAVVDALVEMDGVADREKDPELVADAESVSIERVTVGVVVLTRVPRADAEKIGVVETTAVADFDFRDAVALVDGVMLMLPDRDCDALAVRDNLAVEDGDFDSLAEFVGTRGDELALRVTDVEKAFEAVCDIERVSDGVADMERVVETEPLCERVAAVESLV